MNKSTMLKLIMVLGLVAGTFLMVMPAQAKVAIGTSNGWEFSTDGFINAFAVMEDADELAEGGTVANHVATDFLQGDPDADDKNNKSFRIRTGLLPGLLAFNIKAPTTNGIDVAARVGLYPQIQDPDQARLNSRNDGDPTTEEGGKDHAFGAALDVREVFVTADGAFGQVLAGRALHLFQGKNILNDLTLFSVGVPGGSAETTTFGYIGFGYTYTNFGSQFRYTSPDFGGVKLAIGILDPATISGVTGPSYNIVESPGYEAEISYAGELGGGVKLQAWINGMTQDADRQVGTTTESATASGFAGGVGVDVAGLHVLASGSSGSGIGSAFMMAVDAVDRVGEERDTTSLLGQIAYTIMGATKIGIQYGQVDIDETNADRDDRAGGTSWVDTRTATTLGVWHNITPSWQIIAEYTMAKVEWFDGADRESSTFALGTFFYW